MPGKWLIKNTKGAFQREIALDDFGDNLTIIQEKDGWLTINSDSNEASITLSADAMMIRVSFPMAIEDKVLTKKIAPRLEYQYVRLSQIYSTGAIPNRWKTLAEILLTVYKELNGECKRDIMF